MARWTHVLGAAVVVALALVLAGRPQREGLLLSLAAGGVLTVGLLLYYGALSRRRVPLTTPLAATGVVVPVLVGFARGEALEPIAWVGLAVAAAGVLAVVHQQADDDHPSPPCPGCSPDEGTAIARLAPVPTALLAALAFGGSLVLVEARGSAGASPLWAAAGLQAGGLAALVPVALTGPRHRGGRRARPRGGAGRGLHGRADAGGRRGGGDPRHRGLGSAARVLVVTTFDRDDYLFDALAAGDALLAPDATRRVIERFAAHPGPRGTVLPHHRGPAPAAPARASLTDRAGEVLAHLARGRSNTEIAAALHLGDAAVKTHVSRILTKLGVRDRIQLVVCAHEHGTIVPGA